MLLEATVGDGLVDRNEESREAFGQTGSTIAVKVVELIDALYLSIVESN